MTLKRLIDADKICANLLFLRNLRSCFRSYQCPQACRLPGRCKYPTVAGREKKRVYPMSNKRQINYSIILFIFATLLMAAGNSWPAVLASSGAVAPNLGSAARFVGLASSTLTNTGPGVFVGDVGTSPGSAVIGFPPGTLRRGAIYEGGPVAAQAQSDATLAYNALKGQPCNTDLTGQDLGGMTLAPGVYCFNTSAGLTGNLVLDALGDPLAVWVFQMGSTLTTASASTVGEINGGQALNVFWQVGSSAALGSGTRFHGNILADASITLNTGATLIGRALALNGAVTMNTNNTPSPIANTPLFEFFYLPLITR